MRTRIYVDGFNLYYGARSPKREVQVLGEARDGVAEAEAGAVLEGEGDHGAGAFQ